MEEKKVRQKCIIFGAGSWGKNVFTKLSELFDVIAYADNNKELWGLELNGIPILQPAQLAALNVENLKIFIANECYWEEIAEQVSGICREIFIINRTGCYRLKNRQLYPVSFGKLIPYKKKSDNELAVLFVQDKPCTRTNKFAGALKDRGVQTYGAYSFAPSDTAGGSAYYKEFPFWNNAQLLSFVNDSEFDVIHCSNTPDEFSNVLLHSNKKIVHDCHDLMTLYDGVIPTEVSVLEYIAYTQADGLIFTTEQYKNSIVKKYGINESNTIVIGNYPLKVFSCIKKQPKLSAADKRLHCVYEGSLSDRDEKPGFRYLDPIFRQLASAGICVHIYSNISGERAKKLSDISPLVFYEGNLSESKLIEEMTKYDIGLVLFNFMDISSLSPDVFHVNNASANKIYEYFMSGLPVATNVKNYVPELRSLGTGKFVDLDGNIPEQLRSISNMIVPDHVLTDNNLLIDSFIDNLIDFYKRTSKESHDG